MAAASSIALGILAASSLAGAVNARQQSIQQQRAQGKAEDAAAKQEQLAAREMRKANRKAPDIATLLAGNQAGAQGGVGSTMLTGAAGVDPGSLSLGRSTLLGG